MNKLYVNSPLTCLCILLEEDSIWIKIRMQTVWWMTTWGIKSLVTKGLCPSSLCQSSEKVVDGCEIFLE